MRIAPVLVLATLASPVAGDVRLQMPVDCVLGETCYIQQYVDLDPSNAAIDHLCSGLTYDGHKGTDFAVPTVQDALAGVDVLAAASGTVLGVRDGMADVWSGDIDADAIAGRDCGNGLAIDHGDGWHTQYCHLKNGSVAVAEGQKVDAGDVLGKIGMSGRTQFPHMHISLRRDGQIVDPFAPNATSCSAETGQTLWDAQIPYQAGGILSGGFAPAVPEYADVKAGTAAQRLMRTSEAIVSFSFAFGGRTDDILRMTLIGPGDFRIIKDYVLPRNRAQFFRAIGKKRRSAPWPGGVYQSTAELVRDGTVISTRVDTYEIPR